MTLVQATLLPGLVGRGWAWCPCFTTAILHSANSSTQDAALALASLHLDPHAPTQTPASRPTLPALPLSLCAQAYHEWDFSNMLTVLLRFNGRPVAAAVLRVFGQQLAELPLVATRPDARRQGHARVLVRAIEAMLTQLGVKVRPAMRYWEPG